MLADDKTIAEFIRQAGQSLQALPDFSVASEARLEARHILQEALGLDFTLQYTQGQHVLAPEEWAWLQTIVARRLAHEPLSAILGRCDFYGRSFKLAPGGLAPRPETELLVDLALDLVKNPVADQEPRLDCLQIAELCCGSGAPGLSLLAELEARGQTAKLLLLDLDPLTLAAAKENAENLGLAQACYFQEADLFPQSREGVQPCFDLILVNPPYIPSGEIAQLMPEVRQFENALALDGGEDGLDFYRRLAQGIRTWLKPVAWLIMEHGEGQRTEIQELFAPYAERDRLLTTKVLDDYAGLDRVLALQYG
ncbi:MAG: peptide chain release factor N(5)-glutamine methyltransferase [Eubacteriales bacterium]|nr:peptide chain release factor N(5)-glutamine methyltransferase [Clostridiales bacterium]MDY5837017.1 peptide chain release factor N(5)-glutamine methyltransferase [Eubacteriales bacterium]